MLTFAAMEFRIREAMNTDADGIVGVVRAVYDEYGFTWDAEEYHADLYDPETHYSSRGDRFLVAVEQDSGCLEQDADADAGTMNDDRGTMNGEIVTSMTPILGVVGLCFHPTIPGEPGITILHDGKVRAAGSDCSLERLYVHPDARRRGIGEALIRDVISRAKSRGRKVMELWSDKRFGDAHRLYGRFGAITIGDRICHDPDQSPEWGLVIHL